MKRIIPVVVPLVAASLLAACQSTPNEPLRATAALQPTKGSKAFGEATFEQLNGKVRVTVIATGFDKAYRRERREEPSEREAPAEGFDVPSDVLEVPSFLRE